MYPVCRGGTFAIGYDGISVRLAATSDGAIYGAIGAWSSEVLGMRTMAAAGSVGVDVGVSAPWGGGPSVLVLEPSASLTMVILQGEVFAQGRVVGDGSGGGGRLGLAIGLGFDRFATLQIRGNAGIDRLDAHTGFAGGVDIGIRVGVPVHSRRHSHEPLENLEPERPPTVDKAPFEKPR